jgi:putative hemolysin
MEFAIEGALILIAGAVVGHGVLDGIDVALRTAQKNRLTQWHEEQRYGTAAALAIRDTPEPFVMTIHIGLTGTNAVAALGAGALAVGYGLPWLFACWPWLPLTWWMVGALLGLVVSAMTYVMLLVGQLVPRGLAQQHAEQVLCWCAPLLICLTRACRFIRTGLTGSATALLWLLGQQRPPAYVPLMPITEEDVTTMVREGAERGIFEAVEQELIAGVFEFTDTAAREIMVPRVHIQALDATTPTDEVVRRLIESGHSRMPVYEGDLDHIVGVLYFKDILRVLHEGQGWEVRHLVRPVLYVPEMVQISRLLRMLQQRRLHMAIVVDEHGGVAGLVTTEDLLEQLVGDIRDEGEPEADALVTFLPDGALVAQGNAPLWELREHYHLPFEEAEHYHTLAGLLLARLGHVPQGGEAITEAGYLCTVVDVDGPRIARVKMERRAVEADDSSVPAALSELPEGDRIGLEADPHSTV